MIARPDPFPARFAQPLLPVDHCILNPIYREPSLLLFAPSPLSPTTLLDSLDETIDRDAESAWETEIVMRLKEIDEGKVNLVLWAEARARIAGQ